MAASDTNFNGTFAVATAGNPVRYTCSPGGGNIGPNAATGTLTDTTAIGQTTSTTYAAPTGVTAPSVTVSVVAGTKLLVSLSTNCENTTAAKACYMGFDATSTGAAGITQTAADNAMVGFDAAIAGIQSAGGGTFVFTAAGTGTVTFTGKYRVIANTGTWHASSITVQVFAP